MPLQIRRGTEGQLAAVTLAQGEPAYTTDSQKFVVGDGFTPGGVYIGGGTTATFLNVNVVNTATVGKLVTAGNIDGSEGAVANMTGFRAGWYGGTAGYAFKNDVDTGMFANGTGDLRFKINNNNSALVDADGWNFQNSIAVTNTATVATLKFGDGTTMTTAAGGGGNTFTNLVVTSTADIAGMSISTSSGGGGTININVTTDPGVEYIHFSGTPVAMDSGLDVTGRLYVNEISGDDGVVMNVYSTATFNGPVNFIATATANEVKVGADLVAIKSQGYNVIGVDGNWRVGNVLEVGTGDGQGYITSTGNNSLKLQTSGNDGAGGSIDIGYGATAGVTLYSGNSQEFNVASFNTTTNTINYGLTVNGNATFNVANTVTVAGMKIGLNNDAVVMPPATVSSSATSVLFQSPSPNGGNIIFSMNRFGVQWPLAITRTGGIAFSHGQQIVPGQGANLGQLLVQAGSTATGTANTLLLSSGGSGTGPLARGIFSDASGLTIGTRTSGGATAFNSSVFDLNGGLTLPKSLAVGTTATVSTTMILPVYTVAGLTAITGQVGSIAAVSDNEGRLAYWNNNSNNWKYVISDVAV